MLISCEKSELTIPENFNQKIIPTAELLSKNENFLKLSNLLINNLKIEKNYNELKALAAKTSPTKNEQQKIYNILGFKDENDFKSFIFEIQDANNKLAENFDFTNLDDSQKIDLVNSTLQVIYWEEEEPIGVDGGGSYCKEIYDACKLEATSMYFINAIGCASIGFGITTISAGWALPVAYAVASTCIAANAVNYHAKNNLCYYSYQECKK